MGYLAIPGKTGLVALRAVESLTAVVSVAINKNKMAAVVLVRATAPRVHSGRLLKVSYGSRFVTRAKQRPF